PLHAGRVLAGLLAVVREVAREEDEVRPLGQGVDGRDGLLEGLRAQRIGRAVEADVGVRELHEGEGARTLAVLLAEEVHQPSALAENGRGEGEGRPRPERDPRDFQELASIHGIHRYSPSRLEIVGFEGQYTAGSGLDESPRAAYFRPSRT